MALRRPPRPTMAMAGLQADTEDMHDGESNPAGPAIPVTPTLSPDTTLAEATPRRAGATLSDVDSMCFSQSEDDRSARYIAGPERSVTFSARGPLEVREQQPQLRRLRDLHLQPGAANVVEHRSHLAEFSTLARPSSLGLARAGNATNHNQLAGVGGGDWARSEHRRRGNSLVPVLSATDVEQVTASMAESLSGGSQNPSPPPHLRQDGRAGQMQAETESGLDRAGLVDICKNSNTMHAEGPRSALLKRYEVAYVKVPDAAIAWTSRPVTAILTRRVFQIICLLLGLSLIFGACTGSEDAGQGYLWSCLHGREGLPIRVLDIHVEAYSNVFPDLAARLPGNRQLTVQAGGLYLNDDNHLLRDKCNISMMSPAWVHIECTQAISSHGFWLYAVDDASEGMGGAGSKSDVNSGEQENQWAGIAYSYELPEEGIRVPAKNERAKVLGTSSTLEGSKWIVAQSLSPLEGIYRVPLVPANQCALRLRHWRANTVMVCYLLTGTGYVLASLLGILGRTDVAKTAMYMGMALSGVLNLTGLMVTLIQMGRLPRKLSQVAYAFTDPFASPERAASWPMGLDTAHVLLALSMVECFVLQFGVAFVQWREDHAYERVTMIMLLQLIVELCNMLLGGRRGVVMLYSVIMLLVASCVVFLQQLWVKKKIYHLMKVDKYVYDEWWLCFWGDERHRQQLLDLKMLVGSIKQDITTQGLLAESADERGKGGLVGPGWFAARARSLWNGGKPERAPEAGVRIRQWCLAVEMPEDVVGETAGTTVTAFFSARKKDVGVRGGGVNLKLVTSIDTLYQQAACLRPVLQRKINGYLATSTGVTKMQTTALKKTERAIQKTLRCYGLLLQRNVVCVCVCVCARARACVSECLYVHMYVYVYCPYT